MEFLRVSKIEVNDSLLDRVAASQSEYQGGSAAEQGAAERAVTPAARAQAREFIERYFSLGEEK